MITGAHIIVYSRDADKDRAFLKDILGLAHVDVGHGWLIFKLPPSEAAVHPSDENDKHELYFMCDDIEAEMKRLQVKGVACEPVSTQGWGRSTRMQLPGGGTLGMYEPRHARP